jgi:drug/metabolite transporter (DMT)-like permease
VCFGLDLTLYNTAVLRTSAATAAFLGNNTPVFVGLGAWWLLRRRPPGAFWGGLALALSCGAAAAVSGGGLPRSAGAAA